MNNVPFILTGGPIFDGKALHTDKAAIFDDGVFQQLIDQSEIQPHGITHNLHGAVLSPGYVDLQVNGGGGVMFNNDPSVDSLKTIARAHKSLGTHTLLPTLITDTAEKTTTAIDAVRAVVTEKTVPGIVGLHLEGPHLSVARKGAHDASLIRAMEQTDLQQLLDAKQHLPVLKVTIAPENVSVAQVETLVNAGVLVALGHTNADFETCVRYAKAGVRCVTHLFNAMSQLSSREPGLVGAALQTPQLSFGLIADGIHVHPATMHLACTMKQQNDPTSVPLYLVSDAMAVAGTDHQSFTLNNRQIVRNRGRLTLEDGTLAGADLDITTAIRNLVTQSNVPLEFALQAAITTPSTLINLPDALLPGVTPLSSLIKISAELDSVDSINPS